ncbi:hypothetical protein HK104_010641 [Borealophlyctis nickersoniae]|nr:hypothetical protein HK104_010641 [Borealophlyctis nickersoniae]
MPIMVCCPQQCLRRPAPRRYATVVAPSLTARAYDFKDVTGERVAVDVHPLTPVVTGTEGKVTFEQLERHADKPNLWWKARAVHAWLRSFGTGEEIGLLELDRSVFGAHLRPDLLAIAMDYEQSWLYAGTESSKPLGRVRGSTRKIFPQKGRGRARHGTRRAPQFVGGYAAHGPRPRNRTKDIDLNTYHKAMRAGLSAKFAQDQLTIVDNLAIDPKGKDGLRAQLDALGMLGKKIYFIYGSADDSAAEAFIKAADQFEDLKKDLDDPWLWNGEKKLLVASARNISLMPMMDIEHLVMDKAAVEILEEKYHCD